MNFAKIINLPAKPPRYGNMAGAGVIDRKVFFYICQI